MYVSPQDFDGLVAAIKAVFEESQGFRAERDKLRAELELQRGAMKAADERLRVHGERVGLFMDCDTAEWMADEIEARRREIAALRPLAAKYERLTRALAALKPVTVSTNTDNSSCVLTANGLTMVFYAPLVLTDMSSEGIAAAVIAAAEGKS